MKKYIPIITVSLILLTVCIAFLPCLKNGFVNWDDDAYVTDNTVIRLLNWKNIEQMFFSFFAGNYQPVTILSYAIEYRFFRLHPLGYHITNLILHALNCLLVFWLIFKFTQKITISLVTAILFAVHPLHVESVAWISERKDVLYALFFLLAIICYCYYLRQARVSKYYYFSLIAFAVSLLSKAMAITLPLVLLLVDYRMRRERNKYMLIDKIPFLMLSCVFGIIAVFAQYSTGAVRNESLVHIGNKIGIASYAVIFYLGKMILPIRLSCLYPYHAIKEDPALLYYSMGIIILFLTVVLSAKHTRKIVFGSALFLITILPVLQFIPIGITVVADRYVYMPSVGICYLLSEGFLGLSARKTKHARSFYGFIGVIIIGVAGMFASLTWQRCGAWHDSIGLWSDVLIKYPNVATAYNHRGLAYRDKGDLTSAISDYSKAVAINPDLAEAYNNRGNAYQVKGEFSRAISDYSKALVLSPHFAIVYNNRGVVYQAQGDIARAIADYNSALAIRPKFAEAYNNRAVAYFTKQEYDLSWEDVYKAQALGIKVNPDFIEQLKSIPGRTK